jgi:hypothetical protein
MAASVGGGGSGGGAGGGSLYLKFWLLLFSEKKTKKSSVGDCYYYYYRATIYDYERELYSVLNYLWSTLDNGKKKCSIVSSLLTIKEKKIIQKKILF